MVAWPWTARIQKSGYGVIGMGGKHGKTGMAHRVAYELAHGAIPDGLVIDHTCRNRSCVNPAHLQAVPAILNQQNRKGANRGSISGFRNVHWYAPYGKWVVRIYLNGKYHFGGYYADAEDGNRAAIALRNRLMTNNLADG